MKGAVPRLLRGFTLVELMISLVLGLLILLALITMLVNVSRNNNELSYSNRLIENGRFAMQLLGTDVQHAGYWGGHVPDYDDLTVKVAPKAANIAGGQVPTAIPDACLAYSAGAWTAEYKANFLGIAVQGGNVTAGGTPPFCAGVLTTPKGSSDVLVVRHAEPCVAGSGSGECADTITAANPDVYLQVSGCPADVDAIRFVISTAAGDFTLRRPGSPLHATARPISCAAGAVAAERRRLASTMYYVKNDGGVPTLMRSQLQASGGAPTHQPAQALVENVESFRVEFGIDNKSETNADVAPTAVVDWDNPAVKTVPKNRGDGIPDGNFVRCTQATPCSAATMMHAVAARLYVLVRAEKPTAGYTDVKTYKMGSAAVNCATPAQADVSATCAPALGPFNDGYRRHLFTQTVRLVNVAGRRETP